MEQTDSHRRPQRGSSSTAEAEIAAAPGASPGGDPPPLAPPHEPTPESDPEPEPEFGFAPPAEYDLADYRWVPVKRRPRSDGWTEEKQRRFIETLADTGLVGLAAKEVGMTRMSAYRLRRAPYAAAFARAWDVARERAGTLIEDIAFDRAIEGVEQEVYNNCGELASSRTVYNDRLLTFLLSHLKPERYGREARGPSRSGMGQQAALPQVEPEPLALTDASDGAPKAPALRELPPPGAADASPGITLDDALRAMEPVLPAPAKELIDREQLEDDLFVADSYDGKLPHYLTEQRPAKSPERLRAEELAAQQERGGLANEKIDRQEKLSDQEFQDLCIYLDPSQARIKRRPPRRAA